MDVHATARYLQISPQKARLVCDQVRGLRARRAVDVLANMPQKAAPMILKIVKSAIANAENNFELDPDNLLVDSIYANEGPRRQWRRFGARGRFKPLIRRTAHITVVLREVQPVAQSVRPAVEEENQ